MPLLQLSQDGCSLSLITNSGQCQYDVPITRELIDTQLHELGVENFYRFEPAITEALELLNVAVSNEEQDSDVAVEIRQIVIAERRDAGLLVKTEPDLMTASVTVTGAFGGAQVTGQQLITALQENHIVKGISKAVLQELLVQAQQLAPGEKLTMGVAFGREPQHGRETWFEPLVADASQRILCPQATEDGKVDMLDLGALITVEAGQAVMKRHPPTQGVDGFNVLGKLISALPGEERPFEPGDGTAIDESDDSLLIAVKSGIPRRMPCGAQVDDALTLAGVDVSTGHIQFDGSVVIEGDVKPGMKVSATGNITVSGFVELATLEAGGDIFVAQGIIGRQQENKTLPCRIQAKGKVVSKFAQYAEIVAHESVSCTLHVLHCQIKTSGLVSVMDQSRRQGTLSGGTVDAGQGVIAVNIGAAAGVTTEIVVFSHYQQWRDRLGELYQKIEHERRNGRKLKQAKLKLLKVTAAKRPPELIEKLKAASASHQQTMADLKHRYQVLRQRYDQTLKNAKITATTHFYAHIRCQIEKEFMMVDEEHGPSVVCYDERRLQRLAYHA
ncbi:DUF342 domain-containing protein [Photobacterium atrarenae]|uniref:FapA family protein n=1 Tax=Photobacterium atrarenae TaxID=865757 RepID=A0ABY5GN81_9GAMM|nr:FapA family protein [Photobacterium atrarenae]UTV30770.1 FapA family protein [Photobacterium atrarenae]